MGTVNENSSYSPVGLSVCLFMFFRLPDFFMFVYVLFHLGQLRYYPSCFGAGMTNLNELPSSFLLHPHYCGLESGSIPFRAIVNKGRCDTRGLFLSLVVHFLSNGRCIYKSPMVYSPPK